MESALDNEELAKLVVGARGARRQRVNRALLASLLREGNSEGTEENGEAEGEEETGDDEQNIVRLLVGSRMLRRRRIRNLLLAHILRERSTGDDEEGDVTDDEGGSEGGDGQLMKVLIGSRLLRRRRARRMLLAHLLRSRGESGEDEGFEGDEDTGEDEGGDDNRIVRMLIGSRFLRRKRARRVLLAHLLRSRNDTGDDESGDEESGEDGGSEDGRFARLLIGSRILRKKRARRMLLAHLLKGQKEEATV